MPLDRQVNVGREIALGAEFVAVIDRKPRLVGSPALIHPEAYLPGFPFESSLADGCAMLMSALAR